MASASGQAVLPVDTLRDALPHLRRPFAPEAIRFKVQSVFRGNSGCLVVGYIDARLVVERLNSVCGGGWSAQPDFTPLDRNPKLMGCQLTVLGVTRYDVGDSGKGLTKDLWSDSLKRAAVQFGVGVSVYAVPQIRLFVKEHRTSLEERGGSLVLTEQGHVNLRAGYRKWLEEHGRERFGQELEHGDVEGDVVDPDVESADFTPEPAPPVSDEKGERLIEDAKALYAEIGALGDGQGRREIPPGTFNAWLAGAQHSHKELAKLIQHLGTRRDEIEARLPQGVAA